MSRNNLDRTLPPSDRDDAPSLPLDEQHGVTDAMRGVHDDAPPLTDETDEGRIARLTRAHADATRHLGEALRLLASGRHAAYAAALGGFDKSSTEAAALSRVLSRSTTAKR